MYRKSKESGTMISFVNEIEMKALDILEAAQQVNRKNKRNKIKHCYITDAEIENGAFRINVGSNENRSFLYFHHDPGIGFYRCCIESPFFNSCSFYIYFDNDGYEMELKELTDPGHPNEPIEPKTFLKQMSRILRAVKNNQI